MKPIHIIVGSQMGAAEYMADEIAAELNAQGWQAEVHEHPDLSEIPTKNVHWLVCTSTHGAGDLPDNIAPFAQLLREEDINLNGVSYGIIGLGDRSYDTFCAAAHQIDQLLIGLAAHKTIELLEIDALDQCLPEETALSWLPKWIASL